MKTFVRMALPLALLIAVPVQAQTTIGVKGGINVANISTSATDLPDVIDSKTGFVGGGFVTFGFGLLAIQPELLYSQKGFKAEELGQTAQLGTNYIEIPVLLKAQFKLAMLRPAIYAGPVVSFETGCNLDVLGVSFSCDDDEGFVDRKTTDWGAAFGANLDFFLGPVTLLLDARYQLGLANLADVADSDESVKNRVWQIMAGVGWTL
ncbi:MAG: PorT family protein [Gemmatimonadetes bacterium]|nr:PorT family protein [Gemmatimonadota bacterium]MBT8479756.1 PorT family protein [Gemmatimonadota bacterium]NNK48351.1 PorT family protein [Gemmatimonadota bacterium]